MNVPMGLHNAAKSAPTLLDHISATVDLATSST